MSFIIFFTIVFIFMLLDNKVVNDDIKECSKIKWTKHDAIKYYNQTYIQKEEQKQHIIDIMKADEDDGLYNQN